MIKTQPKAVTLYRSTDEGAPTLTATAGSLKTLLKACLVSGYGNKQGLGWEMPFEESNIAVFRSQSPESNRHFLRVDNSENKFALIHGYRNMSGANSGTGDFYWRNNYDRFGYIQYDRNEAQNWWLVGHDKCFMLLVGHSNRNCCAWFVFGDVPSIVPQDTGNTILSLNSSTSEYFSVRSLPYGGGGEVLFAKTWTGAEQNARAMLNSLAWHDGAGVAYPDKISGGLAAAEIWLYEKGSSSYDYNLRGLLSGMFKCQNNLNDLHDGATVALDGTDDVYLKFNLYDSDSSNKHHYLINVSHWES